MGNDKNMQEFHKGCLICGASLEYLTEAAEQVCDICGKNFQANIVCGKGHYVCDLCHGGDVMERMEGLLIHSREKNPLRLAEKAFHMPTMKVHGPEYHSLVPGVLVAAAQNMEGKRDEHKIKEAMNRGKDIKGGSCGFHGNCGACVGAGIAESVLSAATPGSREERGKANLATGTALIQVSMHGGPQCCRRDAITSILSYMELTGRYPDAVDYTYTCSQFVENDHCIAVECPYFPGE